MTQEVETQTTDKMVPEGDLIAVKKALKAEIADWKGRYETTYASQLKEQAQRESVELKLNDAIVQLKELAVLQARVKDLESTDKVKSEKLLATVKRELSTLYGVEPAKLEGKNAEQLELIKEALEMTGRKPSKPHDLGAVVTTPGTRQSGLELMKAGFEASKRR